MNTKDAHPNDQAFFRKLKVLVVDDISGLRTLLKKMLHHQKKHPEIFCDRTILSPAGGITNFRHSQ